MQQYQNVLQDKFGNVIVGASVAVFVYGTTTGATLYSGNATGLLPSNSVITNSLGEFAFYAANGRYSLSASATNFVTQDFSDFILYDPADIGAVTATNVAFTPFGTISATNVQNAIQELSTDTFSAPFTQTAATYTITSTNYAVVFNAAASCTVTLPAAALSMGRVLIFKTIAAFTVVSASSNVIALAGGAASTAILSGTAGKFAHLQSDGANWIVLMAN